MLLIVLKSNSDVRASGDDVSWVGGAIKSEANSQPFIAQCYIGLLVWNEAERRGISVEELVKDTNYLSGWRYGGSWHKDAYLNPDEKFKDIAKLAFSGYCYTPARWFNAKSTVVRYTKVADMEESFRWRLDKVTTSECLSHPVWSTVVRLVAEEDLTCFYGY